MKVRISHGKLDNHDIKQVTDSKDLKQTFAKLGLKTDTFD
jgi:hypothetical protein